MIVKGDTDFIKVVNTRQFQEIFTLLNKRSAPQDKLEFVQTAVRHKTGVGEPIVIHFKAPINVSSEKMAMKEIKYNWKTLGDEMDLLVRGKFK